MDTFSAELLELARVVLEDAGFDVRRMPRRDERDELLLAENPYFVVAAASAPSVDALWSVEAQGATDLVSRANSADLGGKRWDMYLLLLTPQEAIDLGPADLFDFNYNTSNFRRIARAGVRTLSDVRRALRPFLPVESPDERVEVSSTLDEFARVLVENGADEELAERAVTAFRQGKSLESV